MEKRILLVEDDKKIARIIELQLKHHEYILDIAYDGKQGETLFNKNKYDLIILDIMIPEINGYELCRRIREKSNIPVIMLTAKDDVSDKVLGLEFGANDYITKPFEMAELIARIKVQLRQKSIISKSNTINIDSLEINLDTYLVKREDKTFNLSKTEFDLLTLLAQNRGIVLRRETILQKVWGYDYFGNDNVLDVYIKYIRDKIDKPFNNKLIETVRGVGYVIR